MKTPLVRIRVPSGFSAFMSQDLFVMQDNPESMCDLGVDFTVNVRHLGFIL